MRVVIYESSSHGGCFEYAKEVHKAFTAHPEVDYCEMVVPVNTNLNANSIYQVLYDDLKNFKYALIRKIYFMARSILNPLILFLFLINRRSSLVIMNDFEQLLAFIWVPLFKLFLRKHYFSVVLHDPDRDNYPPSKQFSVFSMKIMMSLMNLGLYHENLPGKIYYKGSKTNYLNVPHGIFDAASQDHDFANELTCRIGEEFQSISIIGNIRREKNYDLAIKALVKFPNLKLIIAGKAANKDVDIESYKLLAESLNVSSRIIWMEKFLTDRELSSIVQVSDIILLNYARSFKSQSGILNLIAPFKKKVIVSKGESGLHHLVKRFNLGVLVETDNLTSLIEGISISQKSDFTEKWIKYLEYASWKNLSEIVLAAYKEQPKT
ncbi:hypothetical protein BH23BAC1_BH23BAC1_21200 [soil metagenome]